MNLDLDTWIISDTHFNHDNIVKYCGRPEDHTERIAGAWHELVQPEDTILHLGDLFMGPRKWESLELIKKLPGNKFLILGNHDKQKPGVYEDAGFQIVKEFVWEGRKGERILFSHYPDQKRLSEWTINIHGHIHNNGYEPLTPMRDYRNVSIEVMDYKPFRLRDILYNGVFQDRFDAGDNSLQTRDATQTKGGVVLPEPEEVGYFGS